MTLCPLKNLLPASIYRPLTMLSLILAGETVFLPAFHLNRYFKSSLLTTLNLDEFQIGNAMAVYGVFAMVSYFVGGPIADRWSPRKLMAISLVATGLGSIYLTTIPSYIELCALYAFWGVTTILAFWAPLIRATSEWARNDRQALAFGILDGGRGFTSAAIASIATMTFAMMVADATAVTSDESATAVVRLAWFYAFYCFGAALLVLLFVPDSKYVAESRHARPRINTLPQRIWMVFREPSIWLQAAVIVSAYSAFKMLDNYGLYAEDAYGMSQVDSANLISNVSYLRAGAALLAGWIASEYWGTRATIQICFAMLLVSYAMLLAVPPNSSLVWLLTANFAVSCVGFFALRGIYFALIDDCGIPHELTGTAVGIICFFGFTPEIYMGPLTGYLIRNARADGNVLVGYQQIFAILIFLVLCGMAATFALRWFHKPEVAKSTE